MSKLLPANILAVVNPVMLPEKPAVTPGDVALRMLAVDTPDMVTEVASGGLPNGEVTAVKFSVALPTVLPKLSPALSVLLGPTMVDPGAARKVAFAMLVVKAGPLSTFTVKTS